MNEQINNENFKEKIESNNERFLENLDDEKYIQAILVDITAYAARLARQAEMTMSLILSNFEIHLTLTDVKTIKLVNKPYAINKFQLIVNANYWLSLSSLDKGFTVKSAVLKERVVSFYLLHLLFSQGKNPKIWSLASELETTQYLHDEDLSNLDAFTAEQINDILDIQLPLDATANEYYDLLIKQDDGTQEKLQELIINTKHDDNRFETSHNEINISAIQLADDIKNNINNILKSVYDILESSNNKSKDRYWATFSSKIHSILLFLAPPKPIIDYKQLLRKVVGKEKEGVKLTYRRLNPRKEYIAKSVIKTFTAPHILVAIDVSGSHEDSEIRTALGEICHIKRGKITICQFDYALVSKETYTHKEFKKLLKLGFEMKGRGGTSFQIPVKEFEDNLYSDKNTKGYSYLIVFTDGYAESVDFKDYKLKTKCRWCITEDGTDTYLKKHYKDSILWLRQ